MKNSKADTFSHHWDSSVGIQAWYGSLDQRVFEVRSTGRLCDWENGCSHPPKGKRWSVREVFQGPAEGPGLETLRTWKSCQRASPHSSAASDTLSFEDSQTCTRDQGSGPHDAPLQQRGQGASWRLGSAAEPGVGTALRSLAGREPVGRRQGGGGGEGARLGGCGSCALGLLPSGEAELSIQLK